MLAGVAWKWREAVHNEGLAREAQGQAEAASGREKERADEAEQAKKGEQQRAEQVLEGKPYGPGDRNKMLFPIATEKNLVGFE